MDSGLVFASNIPSERVEPSEWWLLHRYVSFFTLVFPNNLPPLTIICGAEFELGLELDSAEVRGILLFNSQEWGRSVFASTFHCSLRRLKYYFSLFLELRLTSWRPRSFSNYLHHSLCDSLNMDVLYRRLNEKSIPPLLFPTEEIESKQLKNHILAEFFVLYGYKISERLQKEVQQYRWNSTLH